MWGHCKGFDLSSEMITTRLLVIARVEGRWIGWEGAEQKTSAGDWIQEDVGWKGSRVTPGELCRRWHLS